jgi:hypothetical protein
VTDVSPGGAVFRYVPPSQMVARAVTCVGDVLLEFALSFTGSLLVVCNDAEDVVVEKRAALQRLGTALQRLADDIFVSAVRIERPTIESGRGHRFTHSTSTVDAHTRRFAGECVVEIQSLEGEHVPSVTGSLRYSLDVTAAAASDPLTEADAARWTERYDQKLAAIGAIVLEPVPVTAERAARLYVA